MRRSRVCRLAIRANQNIDVFDLKEILDLVPEDTKIWGFDRSLSENASIILLENEAFKEVEQCSIIPRVDIFEDEDGCFTADFSEVLEEQEPEWKSISQRDINEAMQRHIEEHRRLLAEEMYRSIQPENPGQMIVASTPTGHSSLYELYQKHVLPTLEPMKWDVSDDTLDALRYKAGAIEWENEEPVRKREHTAEIPEEECQHEWKSYMGLSEQFEFCQKCDEKRR